MSHTRIRLGALVAALCCIGAASASVVTYDIQGIISGSPLDGQDFGGYFSIELDDSTPWGVQLPLLDLAFHFNGISYDETSFPGRAVIGADAALSTLFGPACQILTAPSFPGIACALPAGMDAWYFGGSSWGNGGLDFTLASTGDTVYSASATITLRDTNPVPEPSSAALVMAALASAAFARRRQAGGR